MTWSALYPAAQNLILAARALGLGTTFTTLHRPAEPVVREVLGIPDDVKIAATIPIGWPAGRSARSTGDRWPTSSTATAGRERSVAVAEPVASGRGRPRLAAVEGAGTRDRLLAAASATCVERGYEGATVGEIARRAGVTTGAIYNHFGGRTELMVEAGRRALDEVTDTRRLSVDGAVRRFLSAEFARPAACSWSSTALLIATPTSPRCSTTGTPSGPASWRPPASTPSASRRCSCCCSAVVRSTPSAGSAPDRPTSRRPCCGQSARSACAGCDMSERHGVEFSLTSSAFQDDPWTTFAALREACPVHHTTTPGPHYTVSREADVRAALRDDDVVVALGPRAGLDRPGPRRDRARVERSAGAHGRAAGDLPGVQALGDRGDGARHPAAGRPHDRRVRRPRPRAI